MPSFVLKTIIYERWQEIPNNSLNDTPGEDYKSFKDFEVKEEDEEEDADQNDFEVNN